MENQQQTNKSDQLSNNSKEKSTKQSKEKNLPSTWLEILETDNPFIRFRQQIIATERWPDKNCNKCKGLGYIGVVASKPMKTPKLGINRNRKCPCGATKEDGTHKKFKNCCLKSVEEHKRSQSSIMMCNCVGSAQAVDTPSFGMEETRKELKEKSNEE